MPWRYARAFLLQGGYIVNKDYFDQIKNNFNEILSIINNTAINGYSIKEEFYENDYSRKKKKDKRDVDRIKNDINIPMVKAIDDTIDYSVEQLLFNNNFKLFSFNGMHNFYELTLQNINTYKLFLTIKIDFKNDDYSFMLKISYFDYFGSTMKTDRTDVLESSYETNVFNEFLDKFSKAFMECSKLTNESQKNMPSFIRDVDETTNLFSNDEDINSINVLIHKINSL